MPITQNTKNNNLQVMNNADIFAIIKERTKAKELGCTVFVPHVCNNIDTFGAGFAAQVSDRYPEVKANYHMLGKKFLRENLGHSQVIKVYEHEQYRHKLYFVNMIAQNGIKHAKNPRPLNYAALVRSMSQLAYFINKNTEFTNKQENIEIHAPKFGSGLAGGNWNFIEDLIQDIWGRYQVFVYNHHQNH
jgi:hypothetical protein